MKLSDQVAPDLAGIGRVVEASMTALDLRSALGLPAGIAHERAGDDDDPLGKGVLLVAVVGPERAVHGDPEPALDALGRLTSGARGVLLLGYAATELPVERFLGPLAANRCRLSRLAEVEDEAIPTAAFFERVDDLGHNFGPLGGEALIAVLGLANERTVSEFVVDRLRARLQETSGDPAMRKLAEMEAELARASDQIEMLEGSTSLRVGRMVVDAAKSPRSVVRLPVGLLRVARERGSGASRRSPPAIASPGGPGGARAVEIEASAPGSETRRFLAHTGVTIAAHERLSIAGILRPSTAAAITPDATVNVLLPHDAVLVLERAAPDIILVETAAFRPGLPWAFTGDPAAIERERGLLEILEMARLLDRPAVLWRNTPDHEAIGLVHLEARFDLVLPEAWTEPLASWSIGVQLARANPIGIPAERSTEPVLFGGWDPRAPASVRARLATALGNVAGLSILVDDELVGDPAFPAPLAALVRGRLDMSRAPAIYRRHATIVAEPFPVHRGPGVPTRLLEQIACGARVAVVADDFAPGLEALVATAASAEDLPGAITRARAAGPSAEAERRAVLRTLYRQHAIPVTLESLRRRLMLEAKPAGSRSVAVLAAPTSEEEADALVDDLLLQVERPTEVLVSGPLVGDGSGERLLGALARGAMRARTISSPTDAILLTDHAWLWPWRADRRPARTMLLDLLVAGECSRADVVGLTVGKAGFGVELEAGGAIVRRQLAEGSSPGLGGGAWDPESWRAQGARTFGLAADPAVVPV